MDDVSNATVIAALRVARSLIERNGYQPEWGKGGDSPLNMSNALTRACSDYPIYLCARQAFSKNWGGPEKGLLFWETYKRHTTSEALALFDAVIAGLESGKCQPPGVAHNAASKAT